MKAIIYNSGLGKRMGSYTANCPKSMVKLLNGETIFERQIRLLSECGIKDIIVTTGPFKEQLEEVTKQDRFKDVKFTLVENPIYMDTNYIYSMYLAREYLDDDIISLHGDLVFNRELLKSVLNDERKSLITIDRNKGLPDKDFKGRLKNGRLQEVSISIFDEDCFALQPLYKLAKEDIMAWVKKVEEFIANGINKVYAENAFNEILPQLDVREFSYENYYIDEIDNPDDLKRVSNDIRYFDFKEQPVIDGLSNIVDILKRENITNAFVVSTPIFDKWPLKKILEDNSIKFTMFDGYSANPKYEDIKKGIELFKNSNAEIIISMGGGSSIDTAKIIKLYSCLELGDQLPSEYKYNPLKHIAIPTTAGTGSESTRYSVMYYNDIKQSITHDTLVPDYVILEPGLVMGLPDYQKKATILDALSQAIESYWSVNSNPVSIEYSKKSIKIILDNIYEYINNNNLDITTKMLYASNLAGKAINITETTAAHALSYKLTSLYNIAHGHAVSITLPYVWEYIYNNLDDCQDSRGIIYLNQVLDGLNDTFGVSNTLDAVNIYKKIFDMMQFDKLNPTDEDIELLTASVNSTRLKNNPVKIDNDGIKKIYIKTFR